MSGRVADLPGLRDWCAEQGFDFEDISSHQAILTNAESGSSWSLQQVGAWLQIKGHVFPDVRRTEAICVFLAKLSDRALGCRFALDEDNNLCLLADVFPHDQTEAAIGAAIVQMQWIADSTYQLLRRVEETGLVPDESSIDEAFDREEPAALH